MSGHLNLKIKMKNTLKLIIKKYPELLDKYSKEELLQIVEYLFTLVNIILREDIEKDN